MLYFDHLRTTQTWLGTVEIATVDGHEVALFQSGAATWTA